MEGYEREKKSSFTAQRFNGYSNGLHTSTPTNPSWVVSTSLSDSLIAYDTGNRYNRCYHYHGLNSDPVPPAGVYHNQVSYPYTAIWQRDKKAHTIEWQTADFLGNCCFLRDRTVRLDGFTATQTNDAMNTAFWKLKAGAFGRMNYSYPRDVVELKDTPQTLGSVKRLSDVCKFFTQMYTSTAVVRNGVFVPNSVLKDVMNKPVACIAGLYLAYEFGVRPTIQAVERWLKMPPSSKRLLGIDTIEKTWKKGDTLRVPYHLGTNRAEAWFDDAIRAAPNTVYSVKQSNPYWLNQRDYAWEIPLCPGRQGSWQDPTHISGFVHGPDEPARSFKFSEEPTDRQWSTKCLTTLVVPEVTGVCFAEAKSDGEQTYGGRERIMDQVNKIAWDVTPFSFLVDWLCNIGDIVNRQNRIARSEYNGAPLFGSAGWATCRISQERYCLKPTIMSTSRIVSYQCPYGNFSGTYNVSVQSKLHVERLGSDEGTFWRHLVVPDMWDVGTIRQLRDDFPDLLSESREAFTPYQYGASLALLLSGVTPLKAAKAFVGDPGGLRSIAYAGEQAFARASKTWARLSSKCGHWLRSFHVSM